MTVDRDFRPDGRRRRGLVVERCLTSVGNEVRTGERTTGRRVDLRFWYVFRPPVVYVETEDCSSNVDSQEDLLRKGPLLGNFFFEVPRSR